MTDPLRSVGSAGAAINVRGAGQAGSTPQQQSHVSVLEQQIAKLDQQLQGAAWGAGSKDARALRADLAAELGRMRTALAGQTQLPPQTKAVVDQLTRGMGAEEKAVVTAKAAELAETGYSVEKTNPQRFAANMAMELSEYVATGATPSSSLSSAMSRLVQDGMPVFSQNRQLMTDYQKNIQTGRSNAAIRNGG
jgi:hypothetical protein